MEGIEIWRCKIMSEAELPDEVSEALVECVVHTFYGRIRQDEILAPIFNDIIGDRWDVHLTKMVDFWSSVTLLSGRYGGNPQQAHRPLTHVTEAHFARWLQLFEATVAELCRGRAAALFIDRAHRIADSLQIGMNIGPKALRLPVRPSA
jgi:hemoglobin